MALIRQVAHAPAKSKWAYVEYSDENDTHSIVLGGKEFDTKEEAEKWSEGFDSFSYEWKEPRQAKMQSLIRRQHELTKELKEINSELSQMADNA